MSARENCSLLDSYALILQCRTSAFHTLIRKGLWKEEPVSAQKRREFLLLSELMEIDRFMSEDFNFCIWESRTMVVLWCLFKNTSSKFRSSLGGKLWTSLQSPGRKIFSNFEAKYDFWKGSYSQLKTLSGAWRAEGSLWWSRSWFCPS